MTIRLHLASGDATVRRALRRFAAFVPSLELVLEDDGGACEPRDVSGLEAAEDGPGLGWRPLSDAVEAVREILAAHPDARVVLVPLVPLVAGCAAEAPRDPRPLAADPPPERPAEAAARTCGARVLTDRELEVLTLIADGLSSKAIAARLGISIRTVDVHRTRLKRKLQVETIGKLVRAGIRQGFLSP